MVINTCDVNVLFSYGLKDKFIDKTKSYITRCKNDKFVSLRTVKETFQATFSSNINEIIDIVVGVLNNTEEEIQKRNKRLSSNPRMEQRMFEQNLFGSFKSEKDIGKDEATKWLKLIFGDVLDYAIISDKSKFVVIWEDALKKSDIIAAETYASFRSKFKNFVEAPRFNHEKQHKWEAIIKNLKNSEDIFTDIDDEDIYIATEFLTYIDERTSNLMFSSYDKNIIKSLNKIKEKLKLNYPDSVWLLDR